MTLTPLEQKKREILKRSKPLVYDKVIRFNEKAARGECVAPIQLQYSYGCNMACEHCSISTLRQPGRRTLTPETVRSLFTQADALGLAQVSISGGEPLTFPDLREVVAACLPDRFYVQVDTNGWMMTPTMARSLKSWGVDKVQVSLDSAYAEEHDDFRRKPGAWNRAMFAIENTLAAGMLVTIATVVTPERSRSEEWMQFLEMAREMDVPVNFLWPKMTGEWAGSEKLLPTDGDIAHMAELARDFTLFDHRTVHFGVDCGGCLASRRTLAVTAYGDVLPCSWLYFSLGNIHDEPFADIVARGLRYFSGTHPRCRSASRDYIDQYIAKTWGRQVPVPIAEVLGPDPAGAAAAPPERQEAKSHA